MKTHRRKIVFAFVTLLLIGAFLLIKRVNSPVLIQSQVQEPTKAQLLAMAEKACAEAEKWHAILDRRFPNPDAVSADEYLESPERLDAASWDQACDTAKADVEEVSR